MEALPVDVINNVLWQYCDLPTVGKMTLTARGQRTQPKWAFKLNALKALQGVWKGKMDQGNDGAEWHYALVILPPNAELQTRTWTFHLITPYVGGCGCCNEMQYCFYQRGSVREVRRLDDATALSGRIYPTEDPEAPESEETASAEPESTAADEEEGAKKAPAAPAPSGQLNVALDLAPEFFGLLFERFDETATLREMPPSQWTYLSSIPEATLVETSPTAPVTLRPIYYEYADVYDRYMSIVPRETLVLTRQSTDVPSRPSALPPTKDELNDATRKAVRNELLTRRLVETMMINSKQDSYWIELLSECIGLVCSAPNTRRLKATV